MALIKFINQVTKRLNALWNTSLQLSPGEISEGPVQLVNDIGNDLKRTFQGSIYMPITIPAGGVGIGRADVIASLHASIPTLGNAPARFILDRDDIEYIEIYDFNVNAIINAGNGEAYTLQAGIQFSGTTGTSFVESHPYLSTTITIPASLAQRFNSGVSAPEFKKNRTRISSDQISSSISGGVPMPEYLAAFVAVIPPGVMAGPAVITVWFTYTIDLVYKRPYQSIKNNNRALTPF